MEIVNKTWGYEQILVNNDRYCAKLLHIHPGYECSLHYHDIKKETFICIEGSVEIDLEVGGLIRQQSLYLGQQLTINPGTPHRFRTLNEEFAVLLEVSSSHNDDDVVRLQESRPSTLKDPGPSVQCAPVQCSDNVARYSNETSEYGHDYARMILNWRPR